MHVSSRGRVAWLGAIAGAALSGCAVEYDAAEVMKGRAVAEQHCARCHGIGARDESPLAEAPPFRRVRERYPIDHIAEALAEGIVVGNSEMPVIELPPADIDALLTYIKSIKRTAG